MGMFDTIRSSYDLGPGFKKDLQTKDLECCMCDYWISPSGQLFEVDYSGTQDFIDIPKEERKFPWNVFKSVPNGRHGKVKPVILFRVIEVYPAQWDCYYSPFPRKLILFDDGIIKSVKDHSYELPTL